MAADSGPGYRLSSIGIGSLYSYKVSGEYLVGKLFGLFPTVHVHLGAVHYLRLAGMNETSPLFLLFNWIHFMPHRRSACPVYILQTRSRHRIFLRLDGATHFRLRTDIGRHTARQMRMAA